MLNKCPNAKIIVTGYYSAISKDSKGLTEFYKAFAPESQFPLSDYKNADDLTQLNELATKADTFYEKSNQALISSKMRANIESGQNRIEFVRIIFPSDKSYGTDNSWLWKIEGTDGNYKTDDNKYDIRDSLSGNIEICQACQKASSLFAVTAECSECRQKTEENRLADVWYIKGVTLNSQGKTSEVEAAFAKAKELGYTGCFNLEVKAASRTQGRKAQPA